MTAREICGFTISSLLYKCWFSSDCQFPCCSVVPLSFSSDFLSPLPFLGLYETKIIFIVYDRKIKRSRHQNMGSSLRRGAQTGSVLWIILGWLEVFKSICMCDVSVFTHAWGSVPSCKTVLLKANRCAVPNNEESTSSCVQGWWCSWRLDCPRATGWIRSTQSGSARYPAAASDTWAQTPHWHSPRGPRSTAGPLPLRGRKHLATANKSVPRGGN